MNENVRMLRAHNARLEAYIAKVHQEWSDTQEDHKGDGWFDHYQKYATEMDGARLAWRCGEKYWMQHVMRGKVDD